ncbi:glyoxalase-like domain-domain-containing protein [Clohesyomyces aquaticus]|uniref:Glyoxalase-like domain-domain-containing protein n=1 Tax=Clohesyomyces aquaticus TaxID=1231657 RepID=A0A1Y1ZRJ9_9PLEO|nr:glyoxalase-like domain-domain-containing protein [Clohesyomyces aquaticus]
MSTTTPKPQFPSLDHLILFLPCSLDLTPAIPSSLSKAFTLTPGGRHADNLTSNTLILLSDGCYIELISFLPSAPPSSIPSHWWGPSPSRHGWTDWCLTTPPTSAHENYSRVRTTHAPPQAGERLRPDGELVKWEVTFPAGENGGQHIRGRIPFFCHDVTDRELRVPISQTSAAHPCGVRGVKEITVLVAVEDFEELADVYVEVLGTNGEKGGAGVSFEIARVREIKGIPEGPKIVLKVAEKEEQEKVKERGFWFGDVVLMGDASEGKGAGKRERLDVGGDDVGGLWIEYV